MSERLGDFVPRNAARWPDQVAVEGPRGTLTWAALAQQSAAVAGVLAGQSVGPGAQVGILADRSLEAIIAIHGALQAGAAWVPLDPTAPPARLHALIEDAGITVVLTAAPWQRRCHRLSEVTAVSIQAGQPPVDLRGGALPIGVPKAAPAPDDAAYILYTSGTTGSPRGVVLSHRAGLAFARWGAQTFDLTPTDRVSHASPLTFDLCTFELFAAGRAGAVICIVPPGATAFPSTLADFLAAQRIQVWYGVPSVMIRLLSANLTARDLSTLNRILYAGEPFPAAALRQWMTLLPGARFYNLFGPTETNVCTFHPLTEPPGEGGEVPIGSAASGCILRVIDDDGQDSDAGELWVSGPSVMTGYRNRPEQTAARFVTREGRRFFKTGDQVRRDADGRLWFQGRRDTMIKHRGFRIQPEEIEAVLSGADGVAAARVGLRDGALLAEVVLGPSPPPLDALRRLLRHRLPRYMIPDDLQAVPRLPRSARGKLVREE